jgi:hypothetical protein
MEPSETNIEQSDQQEIKPEEKKIYNFDSSETRLESIFVFK